MRIVIQRVREASVAIMDQETAGEGGLTEGCDNVAAHGDQDGQEGLNKGPTEEQERAPKRSIGNGFVILIGVCEEDTEEDVEWLVRKVAALRVFDDDEGVMNRSILDVDGECLVVSQFTLFASYKKGNRPSWFRAARHEISVPLYESFCRKLSQATGRQVATGEFGAMMQVSLVNDGPVTICMDTKNKE